jgi:hypothetical protein
MKKSRACSNVSRTIPYRRRTSYDEREKSLLFQGENANNNQPAWKIENNLMIFGKTQNNHQKHVRFAKKVVISKQTIDEDKYFSCNESMDQ